MTSSTKMRRFWRVLRGAITVLLMVWVVASVILVTAIILYGFQDHTRPADAIIVLGAGLRGDGAPTETHRVRSLRAVALYEQGIAPVIICAGGVTGTSPRSEAAVCGDILQEAGVPASAIRLEESSLNTQQNAENTVAMMAEEGWETAAVVSSRYHLLRARWLYWRLGADVVTSPARIGYLPWDETLFVYFREWGAFHWQLLRDWFHIPHVRVPVP